MFIHCWWDCKLVQPLWKAVWRFLKELKTNLLIPFNPAIASPGIHLKKNKSFYQKDTGTHMFLAALSTIAKTWNQPRCLSTVNQIRKMWYMYTMEYYTAIKKEIMSFARTQMQLEDIILNELRQKQKTKYHMFSFISGS